MKSNTLWRIRLAQILLGSAIVLALFVVRGTRAGDEPVHLATDWSHRHVIFSAPKNLMQQFQLSGNARYVQQWVRRNAEKKGDRDRDDLRWRRAPENPELLNGDWSMDMGSGATVGAGNYPAKFSFNAGTASCTDFVVYNTSLAGSGTQATIVAFTNLYVGTGGLCGSGPAPATYWAYNTGTTDAVVTSPTLSIDGKQVVFIQSAAGGTANLVLLRWAANSGTLASPATPTAQTPVNYYNSGAGCAAPCMTTIAFGNGFSDLQSSPFYDYAPGSDTLYVGDNMGWLHKFTPVFKGAPAEVTTTWPVHVATVPLSSPVYDEGSGMVFVTTSREVANDSGGRLTAVCATVTTRCISANIGSASPSGILGPARGAGIVTCHSTGPTSGDTVNLLLDAPILDPSNDTLYAFIGNDSTGNSAVYQFTAANFVFPTTHPCGTEVTLGLGSTTGVPVYSGNFDQAYYGGAAGHLYACGNAGGDPTLYAITAPVGGVLTAGAATAGPVLTTAGATCSPVTEFKNGANDWIFLSVTNNAVTGGAIGCVTATGCIMSFDVAAGIPTSTSAHAVETGGTSGIVVDGSSAATGASQVYFTPLANQTCTTSTGTGGCAIQASQSALN